MVKWYHNGFPSRYHGFEPRCPLCEKKPRPFTAVAFLLPVL